MTPKELIEQEIRSIESERTSIMYKFIKERDVLEAIKNTKDEELMNQRHFLQKILWEMEEALSNNQ